VAYDAERPTERPTERRSPPETEGGRSRRTTGEHDPAWRGDEREIRPTDDAPGGDGEP
jgi:hypothetical protein